MTQGCAAGGCQQCNLVTHLSRTPLTSWMCIKRAVCTDMMRMKVHAKHMSADRGVDVASRSSRTLSVYSHSHTAQYECTVDRSSDVMRPLQYISSCLPASRNSAPSAPATLQPSSPAISHCV
jgi:hypothetical protein